MCYTNKLALPCLVLNKARLWKTAVASDRLQLGLCSLDCSVTVMLLIILIYQRD